jgi:polyisoprenoid-binding protein YceI
MADIYVLDADRTRIGFVAAHRVGGRVHGRFASFEGAVRFDASAPHAWLTVQLDSIDTGNPRRDAQLRKDFLDTTTHPTLTFVTTHVTETADRQYDVTGDLTIRGATHPLIVPFELAEAGDNLRFTASLTLNRHTWHANWNTFTTALVRPAVALDLDVLATRHP